MNATEFFAKYDGKAIDFDGNFGPQCVDLYRQYVKEVLGFPQSPAVAGAYQIWDSFLVDKYDRILNTPEAVPQLGDILIWQKTTSLPYGHVAIFNNGGTMTFTSFDQNWPTGSLCHFQPHTYSNVNGWLRPKVITQPTQSPNDDETRAVSCLRDAFKVLKDPNGNPFGNLEGMTRELIDAYQRPPKEIIKKVPVEKIVYKEVEPIGELLDPSFKNPISRYLYNLALKLEG